MKGITIAISLLIASVAAVNDADPTANNHADAFTEQFTDLPKNQPQRRIQSGPNAGKRMATWKKAHNNMRKKYHVEYGGEFTPMKWNMALKRDAERWAKQLVRDCNNRLPGDTYNPNEYGVNSAMKTGSRGFQNPNMVMKSWENKLQFGYPRNQAMTQVLWAKTGYVGCADASSSVGADKTCTASVCYYAKPGNCAFKRFGGNWTEAVLYGPACNTACPSNMNEC